MKRALHTLLFIAIALLSVDSITASSPSAPDTSRIRILAVQSSAYGTVPSRVYLPPHCDSSKRYPVLYCFMGEVYFNRAHIRQWMDSAVASGMPPFLIVQIAQPDTGLYWQLEEPSISRFNKYIAHDLVPAVEKNLPASLRREERWLLGFSSGAVNVIDAAISYPYLFSRVAAQSPGWMVRDWEKKKIGKNFTDLALRRIAQSSQKNLPAFWMYWGDSVNDEWESRSRENGERILRALLDGGAQVFHAGLVTGGHGLQLIPQGQAATMEFLFGNNESRVSTKKNVEPQK